MNRQYSPEDVSAIRQAVARLDARTLEPVKRRMLGINVGASHAVRLPRPMTESEFSAVVSDCRRIFDARGNVSEQTNYREWRNGNLRVWTEQDPHSGASTLSMQSTQSMMRAMIGGGGLMLLWAAVMAVMSIFETGGDALAVGATLAVAALLLVATGGLPEEYHRSVVFRVIHTQSVDVRSGACLFGPPDNAV